MFALLGTTYGGDGQSTYGIPDLRGRFVLGAGSGPGLPTYAQGAKAGAVTATPTGGTAVATLNAGNIPQLNFSVNPSYSAVTTINGVNGPTTRAPNPGGNLPTSGSTGGATPTAVLSFAAATGSGGTITAMSTQMASTTVTGTVAGTVGSATPAPVPVTIAGQQVPVVSPFTALLYIIAMEGIFPSRN
jgi:microcystin-dependent protein